jgi:HK97 gp10 family phage protein
MSDYIDGVDLSKVSLDSIAGDVSIKIEVEQDNAKIIEDALFTAFYKGLESVGLAAEGYAKLKCPVDTGRLRNSITHQIRKDEKAVYIGTNVEYAPYVEEGTSRQKAKPFLKPAATQHADEYRQIFKEALTNA